ncbi:hypothetical protein COBT_000878 [Conglomerata obtusa]
MAQNVNTETNVEMTKRILVVGQNINNISSSLNDQSLNNELKHKYSISKNNAVHRCESKGNDTIETFNADLSKNTNPFSVGGDVAFLLEDNFFDTKTKTTQCKFVAKVNSAHEKHDLNGYNNTNNSINNNEDNIIYNKHNYIHNVNYKKNTKNSNEEMKENNENEIDEFCYDIKNINFIEKNKNVKNVDFNSDKEYDSDDDSKNDAPFIPIFNENETEICEFEYIHLYNKYDELISLINTLYTKNELPACIAALKKTLKLYPYKSEPYYVLGLVFEEQKNFYKAYHCFKNCATINKTIDMYYKLYGMAKNLKIKLDVIYYIKKIQKFENKKHLIEEKNNLYKDLYAENPNDRLLYYKMIVCMFELIQFDGFIYDLKDYINGLNITSIKKILNMIFVTLKIKKSSKEYFENFLDLCFIYKEYKYFIENTKKKIKNMSHKRKIQYLIADEELNNNLIDNLEEIKTMENNLVSNQEKLIVFDGNYKPIQHNYDELDFINENDYLLDKIIFQQYNLKQYIAEDFENFEIHALDLLDLLVKQKKKEQLKSLLDKYGSKYITNKFCNIDTDDMSSFILHKDQNRYDFASKILYYIGAYYKICKRYDDALNLFTKINNNNPNDDNIKSEIHDLYLLTGNHKMIKMCENNTEIIKKRKITPEGVYSIREKYFNVIEILNGYQNKTDNKENFDERSFDNQRQKAYKHDNQSLNFSMDLDNINYNVASENKKNNLFDNEINNNLLDYNTNSDNINCDMLNKLTTNDINGIETSNEMQNNLQEIFEYCNDVPFANNNKETITKYKTLLDFVNRERILKFTKESTGLLKDFFGNTLIFNKDEKPIKRGEGLLNIVSDVETTRREARKLNYIFKNLHGLRFEEWFYLIKMNIFCFLELNEFNKAIEIILKFIDGYYYERNFRIYLKYVKSLGYLGMRLTIMYNDFDSFIRIVKKTCAKSQNILNFFCNYFPDHMNNVMFKQAQRNTHRRLLRSYFSDDTMIKDEDSSKEGILETEEISDNTNNANKKKSQCKSSFLNYAQTQKEGYAMASDDMKASFLCTLFPRHLQKKSMRCIESLIGEELTFKESILVATAFLNHSTSMKEKNNKHYCEKGFDILFKLEKKLKDNNDSEKLIYCWYNIGRAYSLFGLNGLAEIFYKKCLTKKSNVSIAALYNLALIYKKNNAVEIYKQLLIQFDRL